MQAVILAGGLGTRLRSINSDLPKPMVPVNGEPFLLHQVRMLRRHGISDFLFLISYRSEVIIEFIENYRESDPEATLEWSIEPEPLGTGGAVKLGEDKLRSEFFLINGDSYLDMDYEGMGIAFVNTDCNAMIAVYDNAEETDVIRNVRVEGDAVQGYKKDAAGKMTHIDAGVIAMRSSVADLIPAEKKFSMESDVYPLLMEGNGMRAYLTTNRFYDIGTPDRLAEFERTIAG